VSRAKRSEARRRALNHRNVMMTTSTSCCILRTGSRSTAGTLQQQIMLMPSLKKPVGFRISSPAAAHAWGSTERAAGVRWGHMRPAQYSPDILQDLSVLSNDRGFIHYGSCTLQLFLCAITAVCNAALKQVSTSAASASER
jgi:hypothetical protein